MGRGAFVVLAECAFAPTSSPNFLDAEKRRIGAVADRLR
jgi:hypothetical protein